MTWKVTAKVGGGGLLAASEAAAAAVATVAAKRDDSTTSGGNATPEFTAIAVEPPPPRAATASAAVPSPNDIRDTPSAEPAKSATKKAAIAAAAKVCSHPFSLKRPYLLEGFCFLYFSVASVFASGWGAAWGGGAHVAPSWPLTAYCASMALAFAGLSLGGCFAR